MTKGVLLHQENAPAHKQVCGCNGCQIWKLRRVSSRSVYKLSSQVKINSNWPGMLTEWVLLHQENAPTHKSVVAMAAKSGE